MKITAVVLQINKGKIKKPERQYEKDPSELKKTLIHGISLNYEQHWG